MQQELNKIIEKLCSNSNKPEYRERIIDLLLKNAGDDDYSISGSRRGNKQKLPKCIVQSFKQLYSQLEEEIKTLNEDCQIHHVDDDEFTQQHNAQHNRFHLLSLLEKSDFNLLQSELRRTKNKAMNNTAPVEEEIKNLDEQNQTLPFYENLEIVNFNAITTTDAGIVQFEQKRRQPQHLEIDAIGTVSIVPKSNDHVPSKIDVSIQVDPDEFVDFLHNEEIEIVNANSGSLNKSQRISTDESTSLWTAGDSATTNPSNATVSEMSTGQINPQTAVRILAYHGNRVAIYNANSEGAICNSSHQSSIISQINGLAIKSISQKSEAMESPQSSSDIQTDYSASIDVNDKNSQQEPVEIVSMRGTSTGARGASFRSSFDNARIDNNSKSRIQTGTDHEEDEEEQSTLNQITPIPTILESIRET